MKKVLFSMLLVLVMAACAPAAPAAPTAAPAPPVVQTVVVPSVQTVVVPGATSVQVVTATPVPVAPTVVPTPFPAPQAPAGGVTVDTSRYKKPGPYVIAYSNASLSNTWRIFGFAHMLWYQSQIPEIKDIVHANANNSIPKQVSDMEDLITKHVDAIVLAVTDSKALCPSIDKAIAAGIPADYPGAGRGVLPGELHYIYRHGSTVYR